MLSKMVYRSLLYVVPVLNNEGLNLGGFWRREKWTKISRNWTWIIQIWKETLQSVIYGMKEEKMLSKMVYRCLLYVLLVLNYEGLNFAHFRRRPKSTKISQNWTTRKVNLGTYINFWDINQIFPMCLVGTVVNRMFDYPRMKLKIAFQAPTFLLRRRGDVRCWDQLVIVPKSRCTTSTINYKRQQLSTWTLWQITICQ